MTKELCHLPGSNHLAPMTKYEKRMEPGYNIDEKQVEGHIEWTFPTLLSLVTDGDEQRLFECISHLELRIQKAAKIFGPAPRKRTQVLSGLQNYVKVHGRHLTDAQIRKYRKSEEGRRVAKIYENRS